MLSVSPEVFRGGCGDGASPQANLGGVGGYTLVTEATSSQGRSSFDLIIWEGQSAFVDEQSL